MKTYQQFLVENKSGSVWHMAHEYKVVNPSNPFHVEKGDVYYTKSSASNSPLHRDDGPAVIKPDGSKWWFQDGKHHRVDGPTIEMADGTKIWMLFGNIHRIDGPAVIDDNGRRWYIEGEAVTKHMPLIDDTKWAMLKDDVGNIRLISDPNKRMQEYVLERRPDLIGEIDDLDPSLEVKFRHEKDLSQVDL